MLNQRARYTLLFIMACFIAGCVNLGPHQRLQGHYQLSEIPTTVQTTPSNGLTLLVTEPKADAGYSSSQMIYVTKTYQLKEFSLHRWVDTPAHMLTPLIVQSLQNTGHFKAVVSFPYSGKADQRLDTEILSLQQEFFCHPSRVRIRLRAQLLDLNTQRVLSTRQFEVIKSAPENTPYSGVVALNHAVATLLSQLSQFTSAH